MNRIKHPPLRGKRLRWLAVALSLCAGCSLQSMGGDTGGLSSLGGAPGGSPTDGKQGQGNAGLGTRTGTGFVVVNSDYDSASVSLLDKSGEVLSESFISSSSASAGLSAALSGDLVPPTMTATGEDVVLIDRFPAGVLTWVDLRTAQVRAQLSVSQGFSSNPHDYVPVSANKAYVTRFGANESPGEQAFDTGNDVLVIDPSVPEITGSISMLPVLAGLDDEALLPRADRAAIAGGMLRVLTIAMSADYSKRADSRLVTIDPATDEIASIVVIEGLTSCANLSVSPDGSQLAVACNGAYGQAAAGGFSDAGIVVFDVAEEPEESERFLAADIGGEQIGTVDFASATTLAYTTTGRFNEQRTVMAAPDTARFLDLATGEASAPLVESDSTPFNLGDFRCLPEARTCLLADAETRGGVAHHFEVGDAGKLTKTRTIKVDATRGLPPRGIGEF